MNPRALYGRALRRFLRRSFSFWEWLGIHVTANHFYEPVPDVRRLASHEWPPPSELPGLDMNEEGQIALLGEIANFRAEYERFPRESTDPARFHLNNGAFQSVDAEILHGILRSRKPARMIEVGGGNSTRISAAAAVLNGADGRPCRLTTIEPYPDPVLASGLPGLAELVTSGVQDVPLARFRELADGDVLFIDSSHVLKTGSDVQYLYLEVLPRLAPGVLIHVHDIFLPAEYPRSWVVGEKRFWTEQYLLQSFLAFNSSFEVLWGGSYMHLKHPAALAAAIPSYDRAQAWPGSFWMRRTR